MHLARVTGVVVSTQKSPSLVGKTVTGTSGNSRRRTTAIANSG